MSVRKPAVSGTFYPDDPVALRAAVDGYIAETSTESALPKAIIAPHAGYRYSGPIAGTAYARIRGRADHIRRVVLMGPPHRFPVDKLALSSAHAFASPLGEVPVDSAACRKLLENPDVEINDVAHAPEHGLEVHLPFLQAVLRDFSIIPLLAGDATPAEVGAVLRALWNERDTLVVISSDLSHFLDYESARAIDARTAKAIEALRPQDIGFNQACGRTAINGLLHIAPQLELQAATIDLRNSGDTAGTRDEVVGYGAFIFDRETARS
jgi:MEMO1 family protein